MQLLASSILLAALTHVPGSSGSPMALRRADLHKVHRFDVSNSTTTLNSTSPSGNFTMAADNSTAQPSAPPAVMLPIWNLNNRTCNDFTTLSPADQYAAVSGDLVVANMTTAYLNNDLICSECYGLFKNQCQSTNPACQNGLQDLSKDGGSTPRWDTAAARFANDPDITDLKCGIGSNACGGAPSCTSCNGPGSFALLKSMSTLSNSLNNYYNAIKTASQSATNQMTQFSSIFAPVPQASSDPFLDLFQSIVGAAIGFIPGVGGEIAGALNDIGGQLISTITQATPSSPADTSTILGVITDNILGMWQDFSDQIFQNGYWTSADQHKLISFQTLAQGGALMGNGTDFGPLVPKFGRLLFQQLALYTWKNLEAGGQQHLPFIAFDGAPCDQFDKGKSVVSGAPGLDVGVTYNGACYYLLDAVPVTTTEHYDHIPVTQTVCRGDQALPGGTNKALADNTALFAGLSLADFVVPAVQGWINNNRQNGYPSVAANGGLLTDPQAAGAVSIPVCDFAANAQNGGAGCPKINQQSGHGGCNTS